MNNSNIYRILILPLLIFFLVVTNVRAQAAKSYSLYVSVSDAEFKEPVMMAHLHLIPSESMTVTDLNGNAKITNLKPGEYSLELSYVGYETIHARIVISDKDVVKRFVMQPTSLKLKEVDVVAKQNASGKSTSSTIGRQAIDHLQAASLADVMQLIPGQLMGNHDMTSAQNLQIRSLVNNSTNAFGASIVIDGVPMSNNGDMTQGGYSQTAFVGTDLRRISADDIEEVEVVRGIPSAEYGDLTSGLVVVHSKVGVTPWNVKAKVNPSMMNYSVGKGFKTAKAGIFNVSLDYAKAWGDPRNKTQTYNRYNGSFGWGYTFSPKWHADTKIRFMQNNSGSGDDPDLKEDGTSSKNRTTTLSLSHNGKISLNLPWARTVSYTFGLSYTDQYSEQTSFVSNSTGLIPVITAMETGYYNLPWKTSSYLATGRTESNPGNVFLKINDAFYVRHDKVTQSFKVGAEYHYDWNNGKGYFNLDDQNPLRPNSSGRPRAFSDTPGAHQISVFAEDNLTWKLNAVNQLRATIGVRFMTIQPFTNMSSWSLSPRINLGFDATKWMTLRAGFGLNSKTPSMAYLYPDKEYDDRVAANYISVSDPATSILNYHTQVYEVKRSTELKNATTTKWEVGLDFKLPNKGNLSLLAYYDKTPDGFGPETEYFTYTSNVYNATAGLNVTPGQATTIDYANPAVSNVYFMTKGKIGNTNTAINRGIEYDFNFGQIKPIKTTIYLSGSYAETKTYSTNMNSSSVPTAYLPTAYTAYNATPWKVVYPNGEDYSKYRRFVTTLRTVTNIPALRMVASLTAQAIWYSWSYSCVTSKNPIGWITTDCAYHEITPDMLSGYIDMNGTYSASAPTMGDYVALNDLKTSESTSVPTKSPITWNLQGRLTKELGDFGSLSLYVNNILFHEPWGHTSTSSSPIQLNTGSFSYGVELAIKL